MNDTLLSIKSHIKRSPALKRFTLAALRICGAPSWQFRPGALFRYIQFFRDRRRFVLAGGTASALDFYPCLFDNTSKTGIDHHYFYQSLWAFSLIRQSGVARHFDVASDVNFVGLLTAQTEVVFVDIRPLHLTIANYHGVGASVTNLPFASDSVESLSCLHVIEHVGLGRYGDPIDPMGAEKACREIVRVIQPGGTAYISVPIGRARVSFNGQRVFGPSEVTGLFAGLDLVDMAIVNVPGEFVAGVTPEKTDLREFEGGLDFGLGLYHFRKPRLIDAHKVTASGRNVEMGGVNS